KPEIQQDIINLIANPDISRRNHTPPEVKRKCNARKKLIFNNTASESSSSSGSDFESSSDGEDFTIGVEFAHACDNLPQHNFVLVNYGYWCCGVDTLQRLSLYVLDFELR
ncbi:2818_t:CDS:2, partial [Dentiscutata erythropus]